MRKLFYTVVLSCTSMLLLPQAATTGSLDPVKEMEYQKPDNIIVDVAPVNPVTPVDPGIIDKDTIDVDTNIKDFDTDTPSGSIGSITDIIGKGDAELDSDKVYTGSEDLSCKSINCADLGYSKNLVASCEEYVYCPFDLSYKKCTKYMSKYSSSCPSHATCSQKYVVTGCKDGYDMFIKSDGTVSCTIPLNPSSCPTGYYKTIKEACTSSTSSYKTSFISGCYATCTLKDIADDLKNMTGTKLCTACPSSCADGEELGTLTDGSTKCVKTVCGISPNLLLLGADTYATLENGNRVIITCASGFVSSIDTDGCISCKRSIAGEVITTCPTGEYNSTQACSMCLNGHKASGTSGCYTCCTAEENTTSFACMRCRTVE